MIDDAGKRSSERILHQKRRVQNLNPRTFLAVARV
jgi:hypothetical protein